jgi:hypothetical protein
MISRLFASALMKGAVPAPRDAAGHAGANPLTMDAVDSGGQKVSTLPGRREADEQHGR